MASAHPIHAEPSVAPLVLVIDDDDAVREALLVLLRTAGSAASVPATATRRWMCFAAGPSPV
jgi:CheY-like chemotaxis protein